MPTDAYRSWFAAHPDLDALGDAEKDHEAALARGGLILEGMLVEDDGNPPGDGNLIPIPSPTTDAAPAVEFAQDTADATGCPVAVYIYPRGRECHALAWSGTSLAVANSWRTCPPAALTTACLAARRAMMERDDETLLA